MPRQWRYQAAKAVGSEARKNNPPMPTARSMPPSCPSWTARSVTRVAVRASGAEQQLLAERLHNQLLSGDPAGSVVDVVRRLLAVQAQDPRGARLAIRSRSVGLRASDVDTALNDKQVLISTL